MKESFTVFCKSGGDVIQLAQQYYKYSFKDCIAWFNDTFHLGLDIDSPLKGRFSEEDRNGLEQFVRVLEQYAVWA